MAHGAQSVNSNPGVNAAFLRNHRGEVCINFSDPSYVSADAIIVDPHCLEIHALIHQNFHLIGQVSDGMADAFLSNEQALLTALRPDGTVHELYAPIQKS